MTVDQPAAAGPVKRVGIVAKSRLRDASALLEEVPAWLNARGVEAVFESETAELAPTAARHRVVSRQELARSVDLVLVLGGDGTLLMMADTIAQVGARVPILGVNFGSLGFLTEITLPELYPSLESALAGQARIDERLMLRGRTIRKGATFTDLPVLNDIVVTRGTVSRVIDLTVFVDDQFVARFKADGLILATPTGSTAYNLAAGGPIVHPTVDALILTPIAPHTLTNRPVVIPASAEVRVKPLGGTPQRIYVTFDGQTAHALEPDDVVSVRKSEVPLRLVRAATRNYFEILRQKLKWAER